MARKSANTTGLYFVTMTVVDWIDLFTRVDYKDLIIENLRYCQEKKNLEVFEYVIMSNHLHMICSCSDQPLGNVLRDFKSYTSKLLFDLVKKLPYESRKSWILRAFRRHGKDNPDNKNFQIWQKGSYPILLFSNKMIDQKANYINQNPVVAGIVNEAHEYLYSSCSPLSPLKVLPL